MIDLLELRISIPHSRFGTLRFLKREDGTDGITKCLTKTIRLCDGGAVIYVTSLNNGKRIEIRCCPAKVLQGHNIFGTNNVVGLANKLIEYTLEALKLEAGQERITAWRRGEFEIRAIDITHRFAVGSHYLISRIVSHILRTTSLNLRPAAIHPGVGVRTLAPGRQANWLFYDKLLEFGDKRKKEAKYLHALIGKIADAEAIETLLRREASLNIRAELKLDTGYLRTNKLSMGSAWSREKVTRTYFQELALLRFGVIPSIEHSKVLLDRLSDPKLRLTFIAWIHGEDLSTYGNRQTVRIRRKAIYEAINVDILQDLMPLESPPLNMAEVFCAENVLPDFPAWADRYPSVVYRGQEMPTRARHSTLLRQAS